MVEKRGGTTITQGRTLANAARDIPAVANRGRPPAEDNDLANRHWREVRARRTDAELEELLQLALARLPHRDNTEDRRAA